MKIVTNKVDLKQSLVYIIAVEYVCMVSTRLQDLSHNIPNHIINFKYIIYGNINKNKSLVIAITQYN